MDQKEAMDREVMEEAVWKSSVRAGEVEPCFHQRDETQVCASGAMGEESASAELLFICREEDAGRLGNVERQ